MNTGLKTYLSPWLYLYLSMLQNFLLNMKEFYERHSGCMIAASFWSVFDNLSLKKTNFQDVSKIPKRPSAHLPYSVPLPALPPSPSALMVLV
jgi:hypothetical protein